MHRASLSVVVLVTAVAALVYLIVDRNYGDETFVYDIGFYRSGNYLMKSYATLPECPNTPDAAPTQATSLGTSSSAGSRETDLHTTIQDLSPKTTNLINVAPDPSPTTTFTGSSLINATPGPLPTTTFTGLSLINATPGPSPTTTFTGLSLINATPGPSPTTTFTGLSLINATPGPSPTTTFTGLSLINATPGPSPSRPIKGTQDYLESNPLSGNNLDVATPLSIEDESENTGFEGTVKPFKTTTYVSKMCGNASEMQIKDGPWRKIGEPSNLSALYFGITKPGTMEHCIHTITYGKYSFDASNNRIHPEVLDLSDNNCVCDSAGTCKYNTCDVGTWFQKIPDPFVNHDKILFIPDQVNCGFSGRSDIVYRGAHTWGMVHELFHKVFTLDHSAAMCDAIVYKGDGLCHTGDCCTNFTKNINTVGDLTCVMGYGPGTFVNVAVAFTRLGIVSPVATLVPGQSGTYDIPALELQSKNHVQIDFGNQLVYFVSYHRKNDDNWNDGVYNLRSFRKLDDMVYVHKIDPTFINGTTSILMKQIAPSSKQSFQIANQRNLSVQCVSTTGTSAKVLIETSGSAS